MQNKLISTGVVAGIAMAMLVAVVPAFAASTVLSHAGIGQKAGDATTFGVAICNNGAAIAASVPFTVAANGKTVSASVVAPFAAGACKYTYLPYSSFGMTAGSSYSIKVTIDPSHVITTNVDAPANYMLTVPVAGQVLGASTSVSSMTREQMLAQLANLEAILQGLLAKLAAMGQ